MRTGVLAGARCGLPALLGLLLLGALVSPVHAQTLTLRPPTPEKPWRSPQLLDYATGVGAIAGTAGLMWLNHRTNKPRWDQRLLIDPPMRQLVRISSPAGRTWAALISDMVLTSMTMAPFLVSTSLAYKKYGAPAAELLAINLQALGYTTFVVELSKLLIGRARPYYRTCDGADPDAECGTYGMDESMISGHAATTVAAASLMCLHQEFGQMLTHRWGQASCAFGLGLAVSTSALRVASDRHYPSDVLLGAAVGVLMGYFVPKWRYYSGKRSGDSLVVPHGGGGTVGLSWMTRIP